MSNIDKQAVTAQTKELASFMVERFSMNPVSCKLLNEAWEKEFPDEVAIAERMLALLDELEHYKSREERVTKLVLDNSTSWDALYKKLEAAERQNGYLREQRDEWERKAISNFEECAEMSARIEELEAQRKLAFTASNRWADKFREAEKHIAELEAKLETADRLQDGAFRSGLKAGFSYGQTDDQSGFMQCMSAYSPRAGIKVKE
ncbi:hypothetical protein ACLQSG_000484 [Salmonella enterica]